MAPVKHAAGGGLTLERIRDELVNAAQAFREWAFNQPRKIGNSVCAVRWEYDQGTPARENGNVELQVQLLL
jgi:hypothetical protein